MVDEKTQRVAYMKGFAAGHRKCEAEFKALLEVSESRLREIDKLKDQKALTGEEIEQIFYDVSKKYGW